MSLNRLIGTPIGYDYTGADCQAWMRETGIRQTRVEHLTGPDSVVTVINWRTRKSAGVAGETVFSGHAFFNGGMVC